MPDAGFPMPDAGCGGGGGGPQHQRLVSLGRLATLTLWAELRARCLHSLADFGALSYHQVTPNTPDPSLPD